MRRIALYEDEFLKRYIRTANISVDCLLLCSYSFHNFVSDNLEKILHEICSAVTDISDGLETNSNQFFIEHLYKMRFVHRDDNIFDQGFQTLFSLTPLDEDDNDQYSKTAYQELEQSR